MPNLKHHIPVSILCTDTFLATADLDTTSLTFGRTGDEPSLDFCLDDASDIDNDGRLDRICMLWSDVGGFQVGNTEGILKGLPTEGVPIEGRDAIRTKPDEVRVFKAHPNVQNIVPPVATHATGLGLVSLDSSQTRLRFVLGLMHVKDITSIDIHCGAAGANGPIGATLFSAGPVTRGLLHGSLTGPDPGNPCGWTDMGSLVAALRSGDTYVNVNSLAYPSGQIRGQIQGYSQGQVLPIGPETRPPDR